MPADPAGLVPLTSTRHEFEAATIAEALKARGIPAEVFGTAARVGQWEFGVNTDILVMVRRGDLDAARIELADINTKDAEYDWSEAEAAASDPRNAEPEPQRPGPNRDRWYFWGTLAVPLMIIVFIVVRKLF